MNRKILICDPISREAINKLKAHGFYVNEKYDLDKRTLLKIIENYEVIVVRSRTKITREIIDAAPRLEIIARAGAGLDNIDVEYALKRGIKIFSSPNALSNSVAELTIALILMLARNLYNAIHTLKSGVWHKHLFKGIEISGKNLGVIGLGRIGTYVAIKAKALGMNVIGIKRHDLKAAASKLGIRPANNLEYLLRNSDFISIHVPLSPSTYHMINEKSFSVMKNGVYIVNTARGAIIDGKALLSALENGKVAGVALDVFEYEPPKEPWEWKLINNPRVIATPHIGSMTEEAQRAAGNIIAEKIIEYYLQ